MQIPKQFLQTKKNIYIRGKVKILNTYKYPNIEIGYFPKQNPSPVCKAQIVFT